MGTESLPPIPTLMASLPLFIYSQTSINQGKLTTQARQAVEAPRAHFQRGDTSEMKGRDISQQLACEFHLGRGGLV